MTKIENLFTTKIYRKVLGGKAVRQLNRDLARVSCLFAEEDTAGQEWSAEKYQGGYTSYASLNDLPWRAPEFAQLQDHIDKHVASFAEELDFDLGGGTLSLNSLWVNLLEPSGSHTGHIHPHSVISGTYYVEVPKGAGAIRFEDPRLAFMMAAPPRRRRARPENKPFVGIAPRAGMLLLWESWLRHEVAINHGEENRISVSFNYGWNEE